MSWLERHPVLCGKVAVVRAHPDAAFGLKPCSFRTDRREEREHVLLTSIPMTLATSAGVRDWCRNASGRIIRDNSKLVTFHAVSSLLQVLGPRDSRIVHARTDYSVIMNQFAIVPKDTKYAVLLVAIPVWKITNSVYWQKVSGAACIEGLTAEAFVRAKRADRDGKVNYWDGQNLYAARDDIPALFDLCD